MQKKLLITPAEIEIYPILSKQPLNPFQLTKKLTMTRDEAGEPRKAHYSHICLLLTRMIEKKWIAVEGSASGRGGFSLYYGTLPKYAEVIREDMNKKQPSRSLLGQRWVVA